MIIRLCQLPQLAGPAGDGYHGLVPKRALYMHPDAAAALLLVEQDTGGLVFTDIYRSPAAILADHRAKRDTQPVGYSNHGYGGAFDLDVAASLAKLGTDYDGMTSLLEERGFYCHRRDGAADASEGWHFNYLGPDDEAAALLALTTDDHRTWAAPAEAMIQKWYGPALQLTDAQVGTLLPVAHATDIGDFQHQWDLGADGVAGPITRRVLAYVTAQIQLIAAA